MRGTVRSRKVQRMRRRMRMRRRSSRKVARRRMMRRRMMSWKVGSKVDCANSTSNFKLTPRLIFCHWTSDSKYLRCTPRPTKQSI